MSPRRTIIDQMREHATRLTALLVEMWNKHVPVGTVVDVVQDNGTIRTTRTRSPAWVLGDGYTPVVSLEGTSGGYALERVRVHSPAPAAPPGGA